ncbi:MAG: EAL domain-containing protein [Burkholderiaceae bacterium]
MIPSNRQFLERTRAWADEINEVLASESQIARRGTIIALLLAAAVLLLAGVQSLVLARSGLSESQALATPFVLASVVLLCAAWVARMERVTPRAMLSLSTIIGVMVLAAVGINGLLATSAVAGAIVLIHILLRPAVALVLCGLLLLSTLLVILFVSPPIRSEFTLRFAATNASIIVFMQMMVGHWRKMVERFAVLSAEMDGLASQMQTELDEVRRERESLRVTDVQSGLPNQVGFTERAQRVLLETPVGIRRVLAKLRIDNLHQSISVLDTLDEQRLVAKIEQRIRSQSQQDLLIGLVSPTELLLLCPEPSTSQVNGPQGLVERIRESIERPISLEPGGTFLPRCHIGLSQWPSDGIHVPTLIKHADTASIEAQRIGAPHAMSFSPHLRELQESRQQQMRLIAQSIRAENLQMVFQPIASTNEGRMRKAEALVRVIDPERGPVSPAQYLEHIQDNELLVLLTDWVLRESARQVARWREHYDPGFQLSVNIPPHCLGRYIADWDNAKARLMSIEAPPDALVFEITEDASILSAHQMSHTLAELRTLGFRFALDDFGIGYSNLTRIHDLPLDFIKIDQRFVKGLESEPSARAVCNAIVSLARELGIHAIAEGVETEGQQAYLNQIGCSYLQGYRIGRPMNAVEFEAWMSSSARSSKER